MQTTDEELLKVVLINILKYEIQDCLKQISGSNDFILKTGLEMRIDALEWGLKQIDY